MKTQDVFPSKYLKAEGLPEDVIVTITSVEMATLKTKEGGDEYKPVAFFDELDKGLILNKTNWSDVLSPAFKDCIMNPLRQRQYHHR